MRSTLVSWAFRMSLKHRPISFLDTVLTDDLLEGPGHTLLPARDVHAGRRDGVVGPALQVLAVVDCFEEFVGPVRDGLGEVD